MIEEMAMKENMLTRLFSEKKINLADFSRKHGIPYYTLYDIARGKTNPEKINISTFLKIAHGLGVTADDLLGGLEDIDSDRYELCEIYDSMTYEGKRALIAAARGIHDAFGWDLENNVIPDYIRDQLYEDRAINEHKLGE